MSNVQSYNALIDRFKAFASGHFILKSFSHGQIDTADLEKFTEYPFMHVVPSNVTYAKGTKTFSFQIVLADLPRDKDDKVEFQREVLSDLQRIAEDLVAEITNHRVLFGDLITVQNVSLEPFLEEFHNTLTGWTVSLDLLVPYYWDACSIPAEWNDFFESGSGGTGSILTFVDSITRDENGNVSLVNDEANPAPNYYYGTNDEGVRGWYLLTDEVGLTCATIGTCQTIIDIESAIDDLQTEIALKGDMFKSVYDTDVDGVVDSAERIQIVVRNSTGSTLTKGQIVYLSSATGNRPNAVLAQANSEATSSKTIGMVIADIANNADGQVAVNGTLHDLDTSAFTAGDTLWLSATTAGGMVANTPPSEPNHAVFIGYVARSHPNLGRVVLAIQNGYELDELHGVQITTPANNEGLFYESSTSLWKNKTVATALGYTPVPTTRSITINGTTQDLSADRTFSVGTFNLPSLTNGSVLFSNGTTIAQDNANLFWDDTNNRLGIGTATPATTLQIAGTATLRAILPELDNTYNIGSATLRYNNIYARAILSGASTLDLYSTISSFFDSVGNRRMTIIGSSGNVIVGSSTTDAGYRLDVNGSVRTTGSISAASAIARGTYLNQTLVATANNDVLVGLEINPTFTNGAFTGVKNNWINLIGNASINFTNQLYLKRGDVDILFASSVETQLKTISSTAPLKFFLGSTSQFGQFFATTGNLLLQNGGTFTDAGFRLDVNGTARVQGNLTLGGTTAVGGGYGSTSGTFNIMQNTTFILPTSGSMSVNGYVYSATINQTGGANGITRGLYINPTLTAAADFRAIENSVGKVCLNTTSGNTLIGTTTDAGFKLDVNGTARVSGTTTITPETLTGTAATSALDISQTWNTTGTPIALKVNITDTASASLSDLINLQVGGATRFRVVKSGFFSFSTGGDILGNLCVGGSSINASSQLEVRSTTRGFLPPRMTTTQKNAIATPAAGLVVYDTTLNKLCVYTTAWETITSV